MKWRLTMKLDINDYVILKNGGIWKIVDNNEKYLLKLHESAETTTLSFDSLEIIRKVIEKDKLATVIERIPYVLTIKAPNDKVRYEFYDEAMNMYDEIEWIKIIKSIYIRKKNNKRTPLEKKIERKARTFLEQEISILYEIPTKEVEKFIKNNINDNNW